MEAVIQGEVHSSEKDRQAIIDHGLESFDALLIEGRKPEIVVENLTIGYAVFISGYISIVWIQSILETDSGIDLEEEADKAGIGYDDEIDADIQTVYRMVSEWDKRLIGAILFLILIIALLEVGKPILVLYTVTIPLFYLGLVDYIGIRLRSGERNQFMAKRISEISEKKGYDNIIVVCGQSHLYGLANELEKHGWSVTPHHTNHWLRYIHLIMQMVRQTWKSD